MAIIPMWKCDRDEKLFDNKKEAEEHDKMLELAANISSWVENEISEIPEEAIETLGLLMAKNKDKLLIAFRGKPEVLLEKDDDTDASDNVTAIKK
ncbi:MAG: YebG family protein [Pseudomonadales bacterium]|nr:YebG family protein [Pseudomonadales bacterium]